MTSLYIHLLWFTFLFTAFVVMMIFSIYLSYMCQSIYLNFNLFSLWNIDMTCSFYFDYMSCWFTVVVLLISSVVMIYSYNYMAPYSKSIYFLWLTNLFILSMLLVINMSDLFYLMLGWDGLGLVSFFLIVYYQNQSSITSGLFTLLMNRIGDSFFLVTIMLFFFYSSELTMFTSYTLDSFLLTFMVITFMTKSAIYPFSPWLPLAMAAPTPISALVHSSTLVTAGLYLMMRYSYFLYSSYTLMKLLLVLSIFTSFYAGMNSIFEKDMKKLIALSTLSHLGFIGMAFSAGLLQLAFFHLLTHALFKSLLFMTMGDIMINLNHSQDIRYLSSGMLYTPMSCFIMYVSLLNLLGIPNLSGYFSKDLVLEMMNYSNSSFIVMLMVFVNVFFTYYYTYQLFFYSFQPIKIVPYQNFHAPLLTHTLLLLVMSLFTLVFGFFFLDYISYYMLFLPIPSMLKWLPLFINIMMFIVLFLNGRMFTSMNPLLNYYFSNMMYLSNIMMTLSSNFFYNISFLLVKSSEMGLYNYSLNTLTHSSFQALSILLLKIAFSNPMKMMLFGSLALLSMWLFVLLNNMKYYTWLLLVKFLKNLTYGNLSST